MLECHWLVSAPPPAARGRTRVREVSLGQVEGQLERQQLEGQKMVQYEDQFATFQLDHQQHQVRYFQMKDGTTMTTPGYRH